MRYADYYKGVSVEAFTDGYAYDRYSYLYLLSVAGHDSNVKAITSALVSGRTVEILSEDVIEAGTAYGKKYRILSTRTPSGLLHQVVLADGLLRSPDGHERLIYVDQEEDVAGAVHEAVRDGYPVPLIPEWSDWLCDRLRKDSYLEELYGKRKVLRLNLSEESLDSMISGGVRNGEIDF